MGKIQTSDSKASAKEEFLANEHRLVPLHEVLSEEEGLAVLSSLRLDSTSIPSILATDAAIKQQEVSPGSIVRITRTSPTAGKAVFYRRVSYE